MEALLKDPDCYRYFPDRYRSESLSVIAVRQEETMLAYVPEHARTPAFYEALSPIPERMFKYLPLREAFEHLCGNVLDKGYPKAERAQRLSEIVRMDPNYFGCIPVRHRTRELCLLAVERDSTTLAFWPKKFFDLTHENWFVEAVRRNHKVFNLIPDNLKTTAVVAATYVSEALYSAQKPRPRELMRK